MQCTQPFKLKCLQTCCTTIHLDARSQPVRKMVVTRQQSAVSDHHRVSPIIGQTSWEAIRLMIESCVEHEGQNGSCVYATFPAAERERRMVRPRGTPSAARGSQKGTRTNQTPDASLQPQPPTRRRRPTTRSIRFGQALQSTRPTSVAANSSAPTMATPSVFVPPQATAIQPLGQENIPPPAAEPVRRLPRVRQTHAIEDLQLCRPVQVLRVVLYLLLEPTAWTCNLCFPCFWMWRCSAMQ